MAQQKYDAVYFIFEILLLISICHHAVSNDTRPVEGSKTDGNILTLNDLENCKSNYNLIMPKVIGANFSQSVNLKVNRTGNFIVEYVYNSSLFIGKALRASVSCPDSDYSYPLLVVVRQQRQVLSWQLPLVPPPNSFVVEEYRRVSRTLCPLNSKLPVEAMDSMQRLFIDISTSSHDDLHPLVKTSVIDEFHLEMVTPKTVVVSPAMPEFYHFEFPDDVDVVLVKATSDDDICAIISVQNVTCPVYDTEETVQYANLYQTMTLKAGITVRKNNYPSGFLLVMVVLSNDERCSPGYQHVYVHREKGITIFIEEKITYMEYVKAIIAGLAFCIFFYLVAFVLALTDCLRRRNPVEVCSARTIDNTDILAIEQGDGPNETECSIAGISGMQPCSLKVDSECSSLDEEDYDILEDAESEKDVFRTKSILYVSDLARKNILVLRHKSSLYVFGLLTVAVFYAVPVMQLVFTHQKVLDETGNEDLCFFNFLCAHPLGPFSDFNHVYSNIGYILFGLLCIISCARKEYRHHKEMANDILLDKHCGIPQHYGLFYAIGGALIMEGLLSACYHVCPSQSNFQFDSSFMYVIAVLCMLKIYQTRHPDINAGASASYLVLAFAVLFGVIGVLSGTIYFRIIFAIVHVAGCLYLSAKIYYVGRWNLDKHSFQRIVGWVRRESHNIRHILRPMYWDRMILLLLGNVANWGLSIYGIVTTPKDFASHLVTIFMTNLILYMMFYLIMKLRHGESLLLQPLVYLLLCLGSWALATYFFLHPMTTWELTPAHSRQQNQECIMLHFYDTHDIWHFTSAAAMFFGYMHLLTLDDDLTYTPREKIPVF